MTYFGRLFKTLSVVVSGSLLVAGLLMPLAHAQKAFTAEELKAHIEEQKAALDKAIATRDKTQKELEAKRQAYEAQTAKQAEIEAQVKSLCEEQEAVKPGSMEECMSGKTTK